MCEFCQFLRRLEAEHRVVAMRSYVARKARDFRVSKRRALKTNGWIKLEGGFATRPCLIVDMSDTGARIEVSSQESVPDKFTIVARCWTRSKVLCEVAAGFTGRRKVYLNNSRDYATSLIWDHQTQPPSSSWRFRYRLSLSETQSELPI